MKHFTVNNFFKVFGAFLLALTISCVNEDFDTPPTDGEDPNVTPNTTIAELKALHIPGEYEQLPDGLIFDAIIISNDEAGNFFRQLVVQDETGGIEMRVDETDLFNEFPPGRKVFVHSDGLFFGDFAGLTQLGGAVVPNGNFFDLERISSVKFREAVIPGMFNQHITPALMTIDQITANEVSTLVQIQDVEFASGDKCQPYADAVNLESVNRILQDATGDLIIRSSGFATFANDTTPAGEGTITGVVGIFNQDLQIFLRDLNDVEIAAGSCGGGGGGGSLDIAELQSAFAGGASTAPDGTIKGTVISDFTNGNITGRNAVIQDGTAGIVVRFDANHPFTQGQEVEINVSGQELSDFNGLVQVNNVPLSNASGLSNVGDPTPNSTTISNIIANADDLESTLIELTDVTFSGSTTWNGTTTVTDASGSIEMFTRSAASFAGDALPGSADRLIAIVSDFNGVQINIRNLDDVDGAGGGGGCNVTGATTILELRDGFACGATSVTSGTITGVVVSDFASGNTTGRNAFIQDGTAGIVVRFDANHSFPLGQQVQIEVTGQELSEFNGLLQVNNVPLANATDQGTGTLPSPRVATVAEINANYDTWESTIVQINNATFSGGNTYEGALEVSDGTGSIVHFTRGAATFAGDVIPGGPVTLTCVITDFNAPNIFIRNLSDVN